MSRSRSASTALVLLSCLAACTGSKTIGSGSGGGGAAGAGGSSTSATGGASVSGGGGAPSAVTIAPASPFVASCSTTTIFTASLNGTPTKAMWTATTGTLGDDTISSTPVPVAAGGASGSGGDAGSAGDSGSAGASGGIGGAATDVVMGHGPIFTAPNVQGDVEIDAKIGNDVGTTTAHVVTVTTQPKQALDIISSRPAIAAHTIASANERVYAAFATSATTSASAGVALAVSNSFGTSFTAPTSLTSSANVASTAPLKCVAVASDAGNQLQSGSGTLPAAGSDRLYVVFAWPKGSGITAGADLDGVTSDDAGIGVLVAESQGATVSLRVLETFPGLDDAPSCPDISSPSPDTVVVAERNADGTGGILVWADSHQGGGFSTGTVANSAYRAAGETGALASIAADVAGNVGTSGVAEAPHLFTDANGNACITFVALTPKGAASAQSSAPWVQCSADGGKTFADAAVLVDPPLAPSDGVASLPSGAFGPSGEVAIAWTIDADPASTAATASLHVARAGAPSAAFADSVVPVLARGVTSPIDASEADIRFDSAGTLWLAYHARSTDFSERIAVDKVCAGGSAWSGGIVVNADALGSVDSAVSPGLVPVDNAAEIARNAATAPFSGMSLSAFGFASELRTYALVTQ